MDPILLGIKYYFMDHFHFSNILFIGIRLNYQKKIIN